MQIILILAVVVSAGFVLFSLARGLMYFSQSHAAEQAGTLHENQLMQNKMMFNRIKWQAITVILLILIGVLAASN